MIEGAVRLLDESARGINGRNIITLSPIGSHRQMQHPPGAADNPTEPYPRETMMPSRIFLRRVLPIAGILIICTFIFAYPGVQRIIADHMSIPDTGLPGDSSLAVLDTDTASSETIPDEFAEMFNYTITIDTAGPAGELVIDTSYIANPRGRAVGGRKVSISICGVDSRMGEHVEHADANHVVTVWLDSGLIDITSIPRDTPCDAGFAGRSSLNILANVRARRGRDAYLREVAAIAGLDTIEYYIDLGFSQARGVLELLGFRENSGEALRVLRSRKIFASGDFQRSFNQGQFIRQMLLKQFGRLEGISGDLLLRAGLYLVNTNLTIDDVGRIAEELRGKGFPRGGDDVTVCIRPLYYAKMAVFDFGDSVALGGLLNRINSRVEKHVVTAGADSTMIRFRMQIGRLLARAVADTAKLPVRVVARLRRPFEQRVWWQIADHEERGRIRRELGALLAAAYDRIARDEAAQRVRDIVAFEERMSASETGTAMARGTGRKASADAGSERQ